MRARWSTTLISKSGAIARTACGLLLILLALSSPAIAQGGGGGGGGHGVGGGGGGGGGGCAPEIDPGALSGALALLVSGTLIVNDWFRRR